MTAHYADDRVTVHAGDCLDVLATLPAASIDAIVTDPPYGLGFMGKEWDDLPPGEPWARECLRVLKPGGHLLAFGGTRTWHRLACAVEDAGFEVRDSIAWLYGSGFPKSLDVSKAIDRLDAADERRNRALEFTAWMRSTGITAEQINAATGTRMGSHYLTDREQPVVATADLFDRLRPLLPEVPDRIEQLVADRTVESLNYAARAVIGERTTGISTGRGAVSVITDNPENRAVTAPHTPEAARWQGWGTALKPAFEPIVVARKPLQGTVAGNVLAYGTGALNVDGCRVGSGGQLKWSQPRGMGSEHSFADDAWTQAQGRPYAEATENPQGRWPTNVVLDGSAADELDRQSGTLRSGAGDRRGAKDAGIYGAFDAGETPREYAANEGGASRFFPVFRSDPEEAPCTTPTATPTPATPSAASSSPAETAGTTGASGGRTSGDSPSSVPAPVTLPVFRYEAKAPTAERPRHDDVAHPTVKPLDLIRWLVRLVTPPGGTVLDPFAGSGTTAEAALIEGCRAVLIEREPDYLPLIEHRLRHVWRRARTRSGAPRLPAAPPPVVGQIDLFEGLV